MKMHVKDLLPRIKDDLNTTKNAKLIAQNGFNKFVEQFDI